MAKVPLLEGEEIVAYFKDGKKHSLLLTKEGWIVMPLEHRIPNISNLSRLFHVNDIKKIHMKSKIGLNKISSIIINCFCIISIFYACSLYVSNFGYTNLFLSSEFIAAWYDYDPITDKILFYLFLTPFISILLHSYFVLSKDRLFIDYVNRDGTSSSITLEKRHNSILTNLILITVLTGYLSWFFFAGTEPNLERLDIYLLILAIFFILVNYGPDIKNEFVFWKPRKQYFSVPNEFISSPSLGDFYCQLKNFLPLVEEDGKVAIDRRNTDFAKSLPDTKYLQLKKRIESHDSIISQIVVHYNHIFLSGTPWLSCGAVRTSTEKLLNYRVKLILPKEPKNKNLTDFRNLLNKHDSSLTSDILRDIDHISVLGNNAIHNMEASTSDYISMLEKFVNVLDWHISHPPTSIVNHDE